MNFIKQFEITRVENNSARKVVDEVIVENTFDLYLNGVFSTELLCLARDLDALVYGYLFALGIIKIKSDLEYLAIGEDRIDVRLKSLNITAEDHVFSGPVKPFIMLEELFAKVEQLNTQSSLFEATGGVQCATLWHKDGRQIFKEDLGRHNAVDKVLGRALLEDWDFSETFLLTAGRVPGDLIAKALKVGLSIIVSCSAPTHKAIELAREHGITLCGFARGRRLNIYSVPERILV